MKAFDTSSAFVGVELLDRPAVERVVMIAVDFPDPLAVPLEGHELAVEWKSVAGANDAEVDTANLQLTRVTTVDETAHEWPITATSDGSYDVAVQNAPRVRSLTLHGLKSGVTELHDENALKAAGLRLVVAVALGGGAVGQPLYAAPRVERNGVMPPSFTGASFSNDVLTLPDVAAKKVRLTLVKSGFPSETQPQPMSLAKVSGVGATLTADASISEQGGAAVWNFPGELPPQTLNVDLRHGVEKLLKPAAKSGSPLKATFVMKGTGKASLSFSGAHGAVIRRVPGVLTTELAGEALPLAIPDPPLPDEVPSRAIADVTVKYHGIRLLEQFVDPVPAQAGGIAGVVVAEGPVVRKLPPAALDGQVVAKIGIIGRAPVDCELVVQLIDFSTGAPASAVTEPASATLTATDRTAIVWLDVPPHDPLRVPLAVSARTNHGRFLWAVGTEPLLRIAVVDPDPGGRTVTIGGSETLHINKSELHGPSIAIGATLFARALPLVDSLLFATVDVSDLRLEYDR